MSDNVMTYEDWLRGCVYHDGRKGYVCLPCDEVLKIADWIEAHRNAVPTIDMPHGRRQVDEDGNIQCSECGSGECWGNYWMNCGARMENEI